MATAIDRRLAIAIANGCNPSEHACLPELAKVNSPEPPLEES